MQELLPKQFWIANVVEARDLRRVHDLGVAAICDLAIEEPPIALTRDLIYCRIPILDGGENSSATLRLAVATVVRLLRDESPTLLFCSAGMSRSPAVAAIALAMVHAREPDEVLGELAERMPLQVSPHLWRDLQAVHAAW
ncbi:dual specificity protein phosphatase family protein [Blastopirellula marina]|uniref:Tyrosine-protein phosphatase domain-containing protein n=1 Tax=Blastopirellula marina DSM 3645 TaxID=314230 RepID=A3ZM72_9BACT|nr:dual specificity protein phosphatase family protein [Blastopirellula marina]EAQ82226.1 hypothetical protein DSM3645_00890 [Blastopirellula marina DSM 3645]